MDPVTQGLLDQIRSQYPWLEVIGLTDFVISQIREGASIDELLSKVRQTAQYKARFPGMVRADGTRRFATEAEYIDEEDRYRLVLQQFSAFDPNDDSPFHYMAFMDQGITPEQLEQRFSRYRALERGSQSIRDAFYVYAGMDVGVDDLYQATVSPQFREELVRSYDTAVAASPLDYETWITRATQRGLQRVTETLRQMRTLGLVTGEAVSQLLSVDPNFAREMMGALFSASATSQNPTLGLDELLSAFDYAMIGSAAREVGLQLPTKERVQQFIDAGVDRARALRGYSEIALRGSGLSAIAQRFNRPIMSTGDLENAFVLGQAPATAGVTRLYEQERSLGRAGGGFAQQLEGNRIVEAGRRLGG